jgi:uncharacterized protein YcbX
MVVDENSNFITQRQIPKMALIKIDVEKENLVLNAPNMSTIRVPIDNTKNKKNCRFLINKFSFLLIKIRLYSK